MLKVSFYLKKSEADANGECPVMAKLNIDKYDLYLRTERNLAPGTVINLTVQLKTIVGEAIADGIITVYPFSGRRHMVDSHPQAKDGYARHNFGTHITLSLGVPIETVSRSAAAQRVCMMFRFIVIGK